MADAGVRVADASDAVEIARIQLTTWRTAYADVLPAEVLAGLDETETQRQWRETLAGGPAIVLVASEGAWTVGFCAGGPAPESETAASDGMLPADAGTTALVSTLLVEPRWGRRGHGGRLLAAIAQRLSADGASRGITWIPEADSASLAFFHRAGWRPDGTVRTLDAGGRTVRELRLSGSLKLSVE